MCVKEDGIEADESQEIVAQEIPDEWQRRNSNKKERRQKDIRDIAGIETSHTLLEVIAKSMRSLVAHEDQEAADDEESLHRSARIQIDPGK